MIGSPYQTRAASMYDVDSIVQAVNKAVALDDSLLLYRIENFESHRVSFITGRLGDVDSFNHPLVVTHLNGFTTPYEGSPRTTNDRAIAIHNGCYLDVRPFTRMVNQQEVQIKSHSEFASEFRRAVMTMKFVNDGPAVFLPLGDLPLKVYIHWVAHNVSKHLAVDPLVQFKIGALAGIFYMSLQTQEDAQLDDRLKHRIVQKVSQAMRTQGTDVLDLIERTGLIRNVSEFVSAVSENTDSVRMEKFNVTYLYNVLGGSWFGNNAREKVAVAIEHVPTWISLLHQVVDDRSFRRAGLTETFKTFVRPSEEKDFTRSLDLLLRED